MKKEDHLRNLKESLGLVEESVEKGLAERQRTIGFHASVACIDMLEIFLHQQNLIDPGFIVKHEWFRSPRKLIEKFPFNFPKKDEIFKFIAAVEEKRDSLCYGKPQKIEIIQHVIDDLNKLKALFREGGLNEI